MRRYTPIPIIKSPDKKQMYATTRYPEIPRSFNDIYVYTTIGDRFDTLALQYYSDSSLWWIISTANGNLSQDSLTPPIGTQLRIPQNISPILAEYEIINKQSITTTTTVSSNGGGGAVSSGGGGGAVGSGGGGGY